MSARTYLDYNATTPLRPTALAAMQEALAMCGNASAVHAEGRAARCVIENARHQIAERLGAEKAGIIFTSGGTEACNLALQIEDAPTGGKIKRLIVGATEHAAVLKAAEANALPVDILPVDENGLIRLDVAEAMVREGAPALLAVQAANNETGVIQPVAQIGALVRAHGGVFFCDAVQAAGKIPLNMNEMQIDVMSLSAHKIGGAAGVGACAIAPHITLKPLLQGGGQELRRRAGTENLAGIAGFASALNEAVDALDDMTRLCAWRDALEQKLCADFSEPVVFGQAVPRLPNTSCFAIPHNAPHNISDMLVIALDLQGFAVSAGAACASGKTAHRHVLAAMQVAPHLADAALRVSFGWQSQAEDGVRFADALADIFRTMSNIESESMPQNQNQNKYASA